MNIVRAHVLTAVLFTAAIAGCESTEKTEKAAAPAAAAPLSVQETARARLTAKVTAIDYTSRRVSLEGASGRTFVMTAGPQVQRLNEVKVGDTVAAEYVITLLAELRPATAEETANPVSTVTVAGRAPSSSQPGASASQATKIVTMVEAVDLASMLVTLKGPFGDTATVKGCNPENVKRLRAGDTVVITYTEAVGVTLVKAAQ